MEEIFGRFTDRVRKVLADEGLESVTFYKRPFRMPGMYGGGEVILADRLDELTAFRVAMHELGHAYRDLNNGPIYNYMMCRDLDGSPISVEDAIDLVMREERMATAWANDRLAEMGSNLRLKDYSGDPDKEADRLKYKNMLESVQQLGINTEAECIAHFITMGE
jgi:hypothetical protein